MLRISDECNGCGGCRAVCPAYSIDILNGKAIQVDERCIACGQCEAVCPTGAMYNESISHDDPLSFPKYPPYSAEEATVFLRARRSIRHWKDKIVSEEETRKLLNMGRYAQTGSNSQGVSYIVVASKEKMEKIRELTMEYFKNNANERLAELYQRFLHPKRHDDDLLFRNAPMLIIACGTKENMAIPGYVSSPQFALTYIELYAPYLGLGTCFAGYFQNYLRSGDPKLYEALGVDDSRVPHGALLYGYPKFTKYYKATSRQSLKMDYLD